VSSVASSSAPHPLAALQRATHDAVLDGPGRVDRSLRAQIASGQPPADLAELVAKIRNHAYRVTDADIDTLRAHYDEDELFELMVSAAVGAAEHRLARALAVLEDV
jgi:alkylhydroperoxidase family enzyme